MGLVDHEDLYGKNQKSDVEVKFATIAPGYTSGRPHLLFSGESVPTQKAYPRIESYVPVSGDRVMLIKGVIIGKIV